MRRHIPERDRRSVLNEPESSLIRKGNSSFNKTPLCIASTGRRGRKSEDPRRFGGSRRRRVGSEKDVKVWQAESDERATRSHARARVCKWKFHHSALLWNARLPLRFLRVEDFLQRVQHWQSPKEGGKRLLWVTIWTRRLFLKSETDLTTGWKKKKKKKRRQ